MGCVGVAAKLRVSASELKIGEMLPGHSAVALRRRTPAAADVPRLRRGFPRALPGLALQAGTPSTR